MADGDATSARTGNAGALLEFSMTPLDKGASVSKYVARSLDIIDRSGVAYQLGPMGTCLEGTWEEVMGVVGQCFDRMSEDCERISVSIKIDYRRGRSGRLVSKIEAVEREVGRTLHSAKRSPQPPAAGSQIDPPESV